MQNEVDNTGIKGIEEQDLGTVTVNPNEEKTVSAFPQFSDEAKEARGVEEFKSFKKGFKKALPYIGQLGLDLKTGSGIAEFFGQQYDVVQGEKRPSYFEAAKRTSDLISEGKVTDAIVSGVDQTLTAVGGIGEGVMAAGVMLGPAGLPLLAGGWIANQVSRRGKAILTNTKTGQRVLANFSGDTEKGFNIESIDVPKGKDENQIIDTLGEVVDKNIVPVNKVEMTDADFESVPTPEEKIGKGTLKEQGFNPSQATAFWVQSGYSKAFPDLTRNEVANVLLDNPQAMKESQEAVSKMYTPTIKDGKEFFSVFRRVPLKGKEGLETDEVIISGTLDPRVLPRYSMSSTMDQPESIIRDDKSLGTKLSEMGMPIELRKGFDPGKEIIVRYDVPKDKIIGYVPELVKANNTRGAKAKIEKTYDVKLDTDKNKLGFYKSLERNAANEQEVFADVRGIEPTIVKDYEGGIEPLRGKKITEMILKSDKKTGAEILEEEGGIGRFNVLDDKFLEVPVDDPRSVFTSEKISTGKKFGNMPNPKYGKDPDELNKNFEKANIEDLDKRLDFVKQEFNLNQLQKPDEGIKALEKKDITPSGFKFEPADPKSRRMYGRVYEAEDGNIALLEIGVDGYSTKRLYGVNAMVDGKPRNIGKVTLSQSTVADDKKIDDLINIELDDDVRGKGFGEKIIKGLVNYSSRPEGLSIRDIKRNALPFWKKLGINFYEGSINKGSRYKKYGFIPNESGIKNVTYKTPDELKKEKPDTGIQTLGPQNIKKRERVGTTGQYIGAPKGLDSPQKLSSIRRKLKTLAVGGQEGRYWYEKSGKEILEATGGNVDEADKIIQAIAITSPQTPIKANFDFAIQAYNQYKAGQPIKTGRFPSAMVPKLEEVFAGKNWEGRKTDDFYNNLMVHIDPDRVGPVTGDIWMLRALGFAKENEMPSPEQYKFVTKEIQKLSKQLGWQPQQTQAAIWVNFKARSENPNVKKRTMEKSLKKGFIKYEKNNKGKNVVKYLNKPEHLKLWFKESFAYEPTAADIKKAGFDYSQALKESLGQISWEAVPHSSTNHLKGLETGEPKIKAEYHTEISKAFLDDKGRDIIAQRLGLLSPGEFEAPGYYKGIVNPGSQTEVVMPKGYKTGKTNKIEKSTEDLIQAYAIARGILMKQESVGWHRPFYNPVIKEANGVDLNLGRQFSLDEIGELSQEIQKVVDKEVKLIQQTDPNFKGPEFEIAPVSTPQGVRLINFDEVFDNQQFQKIILEANENFAKKLDNESSINVELFSSQNGYYSNNWSEFKNGEGYLQGISKEGQSDLYRKVRSIIDEIQPRIDDVDRNFSEKYGFNFNSEINSAYRGEGQLDEGVRVTVDDTPTATTDPTPTRPEPQAPIKKSYGGFVERNTYEWVYRDG